MMKSRIASSGLEPIRRVSQIRQYASEAVPDEVVDQLLELARWTGSAKNGQPWRFIVVRDRDRLKKLGALRPPIGWLASAPLGIAIVLDGAEGMFGAYDEGRLTERLMTGATMLWRLHGARTMASTRSLVKRSTMSYCSWCLSSVAGPFQSKSTLRSRAALRPPA